jgi:hypothetical protein
VGDVPAGGRSPRPSPGAVAWQERSPIESAASMNPHTLVRSTTRWARLPRCMRGRGTGEHTSDKSAARTPTPRRERAAWPFQDTEPALYRSMGGGGKPPRTTVSRLRAQTCAACYLRIGRIQ